MQKQSNSQAIRSRIAHFGDTPGIQLDYFADGILLVENGKIAAVGDTESFTRQDFDITRCEHLPNCLIIAGFIDAHVQSTRKPNLKRLLNRGMAKVAWAMR